MMISVSELKPKNLGQTVSFDYDPNGGGKFDPELTEVTGILEGYKRKAMETILVVAGEEFPMTNEDQIDVNYSILLSRLHSTEGKLYDALQKIADLDGTDLEAA